MTLNLIFNILWNQQLRFIFYLYYSISIMGIIEIGCFVQINVDKFHFYIIFKILKNKYLLILNLKTAWIKLHQDKTRMPLFWAFPRWGLFVRRRAKIRTSDPNRFKWINVSNRKWPNCNHATQSSKLRRTHRAIPWVRLSLLLMHYQFNC